VVLYDHLVHPRLLRHARADAEKIDVGTAAPQPTEQEAICYLLAEKAREGKIVARLKWGDPFIFDSGGSEALFLHEQGVPFEVVPGIPAGIGAASYAGVPLTYPGGGDTLTFIRGHEDQGKTRPTIDWASLARLDGTIVCYAGPEQLTHMLQALVAHGRPEEDSAALIYDGTLATQQTTLGTLGDIAQSAKQSADRRPAILIVGRVTALREHLRWFDARPLFGKRVLVTRPRDQSVEMVALLEARGAEPIEAPMIRIAPAEDYGPLDAACAAIHEFDWIVFASANAVDAFVHAAADLTQLPNTAAVGSRTAERLRSYGITVTAVPDEFRAEALVDTLSARASLTGARVLLPRSDIGRDTIGDGLRAAGAVVTEVVAYRTVPATPDDAPEILRMLISRQVDAITFTSGSAVRQFVQVYGVEGGALAACVVAVIGPITAATARELGLAVHVQPDTYTTAGMVEALREYFRSMVGGR